MVDRQRYNGVFLNYGGNLQYYAHLTKLYKLTYFLNSWTTFSLHVHQSRFDCVFNVCEAGCSAPCHVAVEPQTCWPHYQKDKPINILIFFYLLVSLLFCYNNMIIIIIKVINPSYLVRRCCYNKS